MEKKYGFDWPKERSWSRFEKLLEKVEDVIQEIYHPFNRVYFDKRKQKVNVRIDRWDTWSMDSTLGYIIVPMLKQLKDSQHGAPNVDHEDVPEHLRPNKDDATLVNNNDVDEKFFERWDWVMNEMLFAFESIGSDWQDMFHSGKHDMVFVPIDYDGNVVAREDAELFRWVKGPNDTFEVDQKGMDEYHARVQNGFRLFGKYFTSLWD